MMKRILITGGAGFIGSHVTELFCNEGYDVVVIDDLRFGYKRFLDTRARFVRASLADRKAVTQALRGVDAVMHLAGSSIISTSYSHPEAYFENNLINGLVLLEAMKKQGVRKIVYSSTSSVYGDQHTFPIPETAPLAPMHPYGASKLAFEHALTAYYHAWGIESVTLRYYNAYGPRDEQKPATRAIPMWIAAVLDGKPIPWYWQGRQIRDYVYVSDIAQAHADVLPLKGIHTFNIGSGVGVPMKHVFKALEKAVGKKLNTVDLGERQGDPMKSFADISHIQKMVGWVPRVSLPDGLAKTYEYYKNKKR